MKQLLSDCFMQAIVQNNLVSLGQYLHAGFDVNSSETSLPDKCSYLHWACMFANEPVVRLLLENGADVNCANKNGATALHEAILRKGTKEETVRVIETLLIYKSDVASIRGTNGVFKDLSALELAQSRAQTENGVEILSLIKDFLNDVSSIASSSVPHSPLVRSSSEIPQSPKSTTITNALDSMTLTHNDSSSSFSSRKSFSQEHEQLQNWCNSSLLTNENKPDLKSLIWPQPQLCTILSEEDKDSFHLPNVKNQPLFIYFKPPYTYTYMDLVNKLASAFSGIQFYCIHKPSETPYISINIDKNLFQHESAYSILVTHSKVEINAIDSVALQYAFFTFMQLCKIYARKSIPSLRVSYSLIEGG